ncbi:MAG: hypothetical protein ACKOQ5_05515, partial [Solirubrobacterales bacterium]
MATSETGSEGGGQKGGGLSASGWKVSIFVLAMASLVTAIDLTIISVALPTVEEDLGLSPSEGQWVVNAYLIAFTVLLIPGGIRCSARQRTKGRGPWQRNRPPGSAPTRRAA